MQTPENEKVERFLTMAPLEAFLKELFASFEYQTIRYVVERNWEQLPARIRYGGDLDLIIESDRFEQAIELLQTSARNHHITIIEDFNGVSWHQIRLAKYDSESECFFFLQIDLHRQILWKGVPLFNTEMLLANRHRIDRGFFVLDEVDNLMLSWFTRLLYHGHGKKNRDQDLLDLADEQQERILEFLSESFGSKQAEWIVEKLKAGKIEDIEERSSRLRAALLKRACTEAKAAADTIGNLRKGLLWRFSNPGYGRTILIMGPDGCGKSTIATEVFNVLSKLYLTGPPRRFHLRPSLLPPLARLRHPFKKAGLNSEDIDILPHSAPPSGRMLSLFRLLYYFSDYLAGHYGIVAPHARWKRSLVIFERYYYDFIVDPLRARIALPAWISKSLLAVVPKPDLAILLDCPAEIIYKRKQELQVDELNRQLESYRDLCDANDNFYRVDATKSIDNVVRDIVKLVINTKECK